MEELKSVEIPPSLPILYPHPTTFPRNYYYY